jgi:hypothetical protein
VMLVLLIIFMVTAPMLTSGVPIELPETKGQQLQTSRKRRSSSTISPRSSRPSPRTATMSRSSSGATRASTMAR